MTKIIVYTDGSTSNNQQTENFGGWGVVLISGSNVKEIYGGAVNTTNNKMELQAAIESLKTIKDKTSEVEIHSDSNYVVQGINSWIHGWKKNGWQTVSGKNVENQTLWIELDELRNQFENVSFIKVKGHSGEEYNELADKLANLGTENAKNGILDVISNVKNASDVDAQIQDEKKQERYKLYLELKKEFENGYDEY